jgi:hypothetical protein
MWQPVALSKKHVSNKQFLNQIDSIAISHRILKHLSGAFAAITHTMYQRMVTL